VVFTFNLFKKFPALDRNGLLAFTDNAEKVDDLTVKFNLKNVYTQANIQIGALRPVPQHVWSSIADPTTFTNDHPVASGPFTEVTDFSDQVYSLCRNPYFWQMGDDGKPLPYVDCLRYPAYNGNDAANLALVSGQLDWAGNFISDIETTYVAKDPDHNHYYFWGQSPWVFMVNATKKPFDDLNVRWALDLAIDYDTVAGTAENGYTVVDPLNASGIYPRWTDWVPQSVNDKITDMGLGTYNLDRAGQILDDAGYKLGGDGKRTMPDGSAIAPFNIQIVNGWTDVVTAAQIISQGFQDLGFDASVVTPDFGAWQSNLQQGTFDTSLAWTVWGVTPYDYYHNVLGSDLLDASSGVSTGQFQPRLFSDDMDKALQGFLQTVDTDTQKEIVGQLADYYVSNVVQSVLSPWPAWYEYSTLHFEGWPTADNYYAQASPWQDNSARLVAIKIHCVDATSCGQTP
jgi:peptide/nickel transport system substrate-binding protein